MTTSNLIAMTYEIVVQELLTRFPHLQAACGDYMDEEVPLPYIALGCVLIPRLEKALAENEVTTMSEICGFFEVVARDSKTDDRLANLLAVVLGEWLRSTPDEHIIAPRLGTETRRVCGYIASRDRSPDCD
jgi:hypothetical protein